MEPQKLVLNFVLTIELFFVSLFKIKKNRVTFISLTSNKLSGDFKLIYDQLDPEVFDIKLCMIHYNKKLYGQFLYFINCIKQLYLINTSRVVILQDNNYVVSKFKRKGVIVLQVWHACGAIKKFGNVIERQYSINNYDYVLATSSYWQDPYSQAFGIEPSHVLPIGMPRTDKLFKEDIVAEKRAKMLSRYPQLAGKKVILYAPTFRGNIYKGFSTIPFDAKKMIDELGEDYVVLYKYHPLLGNVMLAKNDRIINMNHIDVHTLFCVSDYLISDYSSVVFDFMILEKPLIFFTPDLKSYIEEVGTFVDIEKLGCPVCYDEEAIIKCIQNNDFSDSHIKELKDTFFDMQDGKSTERVAAFLKEQIKK